VTLQQFDRRFCKDLAKQISALYLRQGGPPLTQAFDLFFPERHSVPFVFSSPHSGRDYASTFGAQSRLDPLTLRSSEDAYVDQLFAAAPAYGAPLLASRAPRAFVDLNRAKDELDPAVIEGVLSSHHNPRINSGLGVVPRVVAGGKAIYSGRITRAEAEARLAGFWHPYHQQLHMLMRQTTVQFGKAILIDCHSMPHEAITSHSRASKICPDVVLGDRFGVAAGLGIMSQLEDAFTAAGLRVARNAPFAGAYITQAYGKPSSGQHVVQVEIDRSLYMDEARVEPRSDFDAFQALISGVIAQITGARDQEQPLAAE
jgi:N-formylglutamate amidohydrolase